MGKQKEHTVRLTSENKLLSERNALLEHELRDLKQSKDYLTEVNATLLEATNNLKKKFQIVEQQKDKEIAALKQSLQDIELTNRVLVTENKSLNELHYTLDERLGELETPFTRQQVALNMCIDKFQTMSSFLSLSLYYDKLEAIRKEEAWDDLDLISQKIWDMLAAILSNKLE